MTKILVTGATGQLGGRTLDFLLDRAPAHDLIALARDPSKLAHLAARGVDVRRGDYADPASLEQAFSGVDKLLFVSTTAFSDAVTHHRNVVEAAKAAGVGHVHYTSLQTRPGSDVVIAHVSEWEAFTLEALAKSGLVVTLLRNSIYLDSLPFMLGEAVLSEGVRLPADATPAALVAVADLAEANAIILTTDGHGGKEYTLAGSQTVSAPSLAQLLSELSGRAVGYERLSREDFVQYRIGKGLPEPVASFMADWFQAISAGQFSEVSGELERILGRKPATAREILQGTYAT
jgi:NAD(P)H dehydrogenase (quinone)